MVLRNSGWKMKGLDPYDALAGTRVPGWMRSRPRARQILIQLRKRTPVNLAPLLGVKPCLIAKALGCFLTAEARYQVAEGTSPTQRLETARGIVKSMCEAAGNCGGGAWGYEFDVQTRWAYYAPGSPNLLPRSSPVRCPRGGGGSFAWKSGLMAARRRPNTCDGAGAACQWGRAVQLYPG